MINRGQRMTALRDETGYGAALKAVGYALFACLMACARIMQSGAPFGIAAVAAAGSGVNGASALCGAALGYLLSGGIEWGIRYVAAAVLVYTLAFIFHELDIYSHSFFMPTCAALVMMLTGFLTSYTAQRSEPVPFFASLFLEITLALAGTYFFREAVRNEQSRTESDELRHSVSVLMTAGSISIALSGLELFGTVSLGRTAALIIVISSASRGGMLTGAAVGTAMGLSADIASNEAAFYTMVYSFSGLFAGVFSRHGKVIFLISYILADALGVVCAWNGALNTSALYECFCASVIVLLLPQEWIERLALLKRAEHGNGETALRRFVAGRVKNLSEAYSELYNTVQDNVSEPYCDENIARIFDRAADEVCVRCRYKNRCWNNDYMDTLSALNDASNAMRENGRMTENDLPDWFRERCSSLPGFIASVNAELRSLSYRTEMRRHISENRSIAWGQYLDMAEILMSVSDELGSINGAEPMAERRLLRYLRTLGIDAEASCCRDCAGRMRVVIESGRLEPLTNEPDYLTRLSEVVGVRLCRPEYNEGSSRLLLLEAEPLAVSVGIAAMKKQGESVSGDKGTYFKTDSGVLCVILSDGMGTGENAAEDSSRVIAILEKFLRSGVDPAVAMKLLNSVMLLRSADKWGYATVDLVCIDLFSGDTCFYKYGAAPSFVKNGKTIRRIKGETLAAGLSMGDGIAPDTVRMRLRPGSTAIIASDGVLADRDDEWLKTVLSEGAENMKGLAAATLRKAESLYGAADDMTVVAICVEERV